MADSQPPFPDDLWKLLVSIVKDGDQHQAALRALCLTSKRAKLDAILSLYEKPYIHTGNYKKFIETIQLNDAFARQIKHLDLGRLHTPASGFSLEEDQELVGILLARCNETL
jgi:hypothetical protein